MICPVAVLALLAIFALMAQLRLSNAESRIGMPAGRVVYLDMPDTASPHELLSSERYGLVGRPDYIIEGDDGNLIPVELKSADCPGGGPYGNHVAQLIAYCLLVEDSLHRSVTEGVLRYRDRDVRVKFDDEHRRRVLQVIAAIRASQAGEAVMRGHGRLNKCLACAYRNTCPDPIRLGLQ